MPDYFCDWWEIDIWWQHLHGAQSDASLIDVVDMSLVTAFRVYYTFLNAKPCHIQ